MAETWLKCTECKKDIPFGAMHYVCSVSTCKRSKFRLVFCTPVCWDSHLSTVRHREAWAEEARAPTKEAWQRELAAAAQDAPRRAPTPAQGIRSVPAPAPPPAPIVRQRPATVEGLAPPPAPAPRGPAPTPDSVQPAPRGPAPTPDSVQPAPRSPAPTPDSVQPAPRGPAPTPDSVQPRPAATEAPRPMPAAVAPRRVVASEMSSTVAAQLEGLSLSEVVDRDVLVVVSKLKKYIKDRSGFNCSDAVVDLMSDHVRNICDDAIRAAARDERKTVLERDIPRPRR